MVLTKPDTLQALRARYNRALEEIHDQESINLGVASSPSSLARNVFDFQDGMKLIVSRERCEHGKVMLHLSASFGVGSEVYRRLEIFKRKTKGNFEEVTAEFERLALEAFRQLSGDRRTFRLVYWSDAMVPHWVVNEDGSETC